MGKPIELGDLLVAHAKAEEVKRGWTPEVKERCAGKCGDMGDPPCYRLPELTSDAKPEDIKPCAECLKGGA